MRRYDPTRHYLERALFVVGNQNSGKSTQIRSIFGDRRLGTDRQIPGQGRFPDWNALSNDRWLLIRSSSPHEKGDSPLEWTRKIWSKHDPKDRYRWNFLGALQPTTFKAMPDCVDSIEYFQAKFTPERCRALFLDPTQHGPSTVDVVPYLSRLRSLGVEVVRIDARAPKDNGLLIADFFDFT